MAPLLLVSLTTNLISSIAALITGIIIFYLFRNPNAIERIDAFFTENIVGKLKIWALISTATECVGLIFIAVEERNVDIYNAIMRFSGMGVIEISLVYLFIVVSSALQDKVINSIFEDGKVEVWETIKGLFVYVLVVAVIFIPLHFPTYVIAQLYFEAAGSIRLGYNYETTSRLPWDQIISIPMNRQSHLELGAMIYIYLTPGISIIQMIVTPIVKIRDKVRELAEAEDEDEEDYDDEDDSEGYDEDDDMSIIGNGDMKPVLKSLSDILDISPGQVSKKLRELLGESGDTKSTHPDIRKKKRTPIQVKEDLKDLFLGDDDPADLHGIDGYNYLNALIEKKDDEFQIILHDYDDATRALRTAVEEDEKEKLKLKVDKLKDSTEVIRRKLKSLNLQQDNVKNNLEKFCRDSGMYPDNDD